MLLIIVTGIFVFGVLFAAFKVRQSKVEFDADFWGPVTTIGLMGGFIFALALPMLITTNVIQYTVPIDGGTVHKTDDLNGQTQYYIKSNGDLISINDHGQGIGFDIGTANEASWVCERTKAWVAPFTWDNEVCWWSIVAERS